MIEYQNTSSLAGKFQAEMHCFGPSIRSPYFEELE
jgi:hypothetical protein